MTSVTSATGKDDSVALRRQRCSALELHLSFAIRSRRSVNHGSTSSRDRSKWNAFSTSTECILTFRELRWARQYLAWRSHLSLHNDFCLFRAFTDCSSNFSRVDAFQLPFNSPEWTWDMMGMKRNNKLHNVQLPKGMRCILLRTCFSCIAGLESQPVLDGTRSVRRAHPTLQNTWVHWSQLSQKQNTFSKLIGETLLSTVRTLVS